MSVTGGEEPGATDAGVPAGGAEPGAGTDPVVLELYQLAVEMADRVSARRGLANTFFLTLNTGLAALLGANNLRWYVAAAGIVFAGAWWWQLRSYRRLSAAKFEVINAIEARLPLQLFSEEWRYLQRVSSPGWPRFLGAFRGVARGIPRVGGVRARGTACVRRHLRG